MSNLKPLVKTFTDPQRPPISPITPAMAKAAAEAPLSKNVWNRPVLVPQKWNAPRSRD